MRTLEFAAVVPPWPEWMNLKLQNAQAAILLTAEHILSAHAGDALDPQRVLDLLGAMTDRATEVHAWLYTFRDYRQQLVHKLGRDAISGFAGDIEAAFRGHTENLIIDLNPPVDRLTNESDGLIVLSSRWVNCCRWDCHQASCVYATA